VEIVAEMGGLDSFFGRDARHVLGHYV
jgi:hypothetical protein